MLDMCNSVCHWYIMSVTGSVNCLLIDCHKLPTDKQY